MIFEFVDPEYNTKYICRLVENYEKFGTPSIKDHMVHWDLESEEVSPYARKYIESHLRNRTFS